MALLLGTVSGVLFALGMCMALLPEWNAFAQGVVLGAVGLVLDMKHLGFWLGDALAGFTPLVIGIVFYFVGSWRKPQFDK